MIKLKPDKSSSAKVSWIKALFLHVRTFCAGEVLFPWGTVRFYSLSNTSVINNPAACCSFVCVEGDRVFHRLSPSCSEQVIRALCTCVLAIFVTYSGWSSTLKDLSKITQTTVRHVLLVSNILQTEKVVLFVVSMLPAVDGSRLAISLGKVDASFFSKSGGFESLDQYKHLSFSLERAVSRQGKVVQIFCLSLGG